MQKTRKLILALLAFCALIAGFIVPIPAQADVIAPGADPAATAEYSAVRISEDAEPPPPPQITIDLAANWDSSAPKKSPPGAQLLAYFVVNANDVAQGSAGHYNFTVVLEGVNAGFATYARGTASNGGRTLTVPFNNFPLASSERFGFGLIGDQQGDMGAIVRVLNSAGAEVARAYLDPRPVLPGTKAWDAVLSQGLQVLGTIQNQSLILPINLSVDRTSPIPAGDIVFNLSFDDANGESARRPARYRYTLRDNWTDAPFPLGVLNLVAQNSNPGPHTVPGGQAVQAVVTEVTGGWQVRLPAGYFNPFADLPRYSGTVPVGTAIDPDMRVFATKQFLFASGPITDVHFTEITLSAANLTYAYWGSVRETDRGVPSPDVAGQPTINNRAAFTYSPAGGFSAAWGAPPPPGAGIQGWLWGNSAAAWSFGPTPSLQTHTAKYTTTTWTAADYLPFGSEVHAHASTTGPGHTASCIAVNPETTPFQGRALIHTSGQFLDTSLMRVWYTTAPVGNLSGIDCYALTGWHEVPQFSHVSGTTNFALFALPNPERITAIKGISYGGITLASLHHTRMASPQAGGWMSGRGWRPHNGEITQIDNPVRESQHVAAATPNQPFAGTNGTRDILWGNYEFPRVVKSASNTAPAYGETVTFTIRAVNLSNAGDFPMVIHDQMDTGLVFVPGSVRVDGVAAADPTASGVQTGRFVPGAQVRELVFDLGLRPANEIVTLTFEAVARWNVGTVINSAWMVPTERAAANMPGTGIGTAYGTLSQVSLNRQLTGTMELSKTVARNYMGPDAGLLAGTASAANRWLLQVVNGTSVEAHSTIVDIFPFYGDGRGTTANIAHAVTSFRTDHPVYVYYTRHDAGELDPDPAAAVNAINRGEAGSIWNRWADFGADDYLVWESEYRPTGFLIVTSSPMGSGARVNYEIGFTAQTTIGQSGLFVNYAWQRDTANVLRLVRAAVTISEFPEITVTKTIDGQSVVSVAPNTELLVDFQVINTGTEPLRNISFADLTLAGPEVKDIVFESFIVNPDGYLAYADSGELLVLAPGSYVTATGVLPGMAAGERHENRASVIGIGQRTGDFVHDAANLIVQAEPPAAPQPPETPPPPYGPPPAEPVELAPEPEPEQAPAPEPEPEPVPEPEPEPAAPQPAALIRPEHPATGANAVLLVVAGALVTAGSGVMGSRAEKKRKTHQE